jgi:ketosteroid isomerase-like protein
MAMSDRENVAVVQRWFDAVHAQDPDLFAELLDERYVWEAGSTSGSGVQAAMAAWRSLFIAVDVLAIVAGVILYFAN